MGRGSKGRPRSSRGSPIPVGKVDAAAPIAFRGLLAHASAARRVRAIVRTKRDPTIAFHDYLYLGFNDDTAGRPVFDGLMPHVAGTRRMFMNLRFAQPDRGLPVVGMPEAWPADAFPFAYAETMNPFTGERDGLLRRCRLSATCPKIVQTDTEYEGWTARASLLVTDPRAVILTCRLRC